MSTCRGCGAPIRWVRTEHGNLMPIDPDPDPDGNVELVDDTGAALDAAALDRFQRTVTAVVHAQPTLTGGDRWMPHHATCPDADQYQGATVNVVGLDLSLSCTGVADDTGTTHTVIVAPVRCGGDDLIARCIRIRLQIIDLTPARLDLVVIEDLVARSQAAAALGVLHGTIRVWLRAAQVPVLLVPPATLKKYATGKGNANKDLVRDAARDRLGLPAGVTSDEADAAWLRQIGLALAGDPAAVAVPKSHQAALDKLRGDDA